MRSYTGIGLLILHISILILQVSAGGVFELKLDSFRNDEGLNSDSNCCQGYRRGGRCSSTCRTFFRICLTHYQTNISPDTACTFGSLVTPVIGDNTFTFPDTLHSFSNPIRLPFEFSWPGTFSIIIEAWHDTTLTGPSQASPRELILRLATQRSVQTGEEWSNFIHTDTKGSTKELTYSYRVICDEDYFGPGCSELCSPRDDMFGHFTCSENGTKVCLEGWTGQYCDQAHCLPGCLHGGCEQPNECQCLLGWQGPLCDQCIPYPGCQHGSCQQPWQCNCEEGWGGLFCNQDLNFCTHHQPCRHGATCTNTGQGSYTCACQPGYSGTNCELEVDTCEFQPCLNGGTCTNTGDGYQCQCPSGFRGRHCESSATSCAENPCRNGTCYDTSQGSYRCQCRPGFTGVDCERDIDECSSKPCLNGGRCIDEPNGFRCICPPGYSGTTCHEDRNDCSIEPCLNGGTCLDRVNNYECRCVPGFVGALCQEDVDDCQNKPCANGGTCHDLVNDFTCDCAPGFTGKDCRVQIDWCDASPCLNGGTCVNQLAGYECRCPSAFVGKTCEYIVGYSTTTSGGKVATAQTTDITTKDTAVVPVNFQTSGKGESVVTMYQLLLIICLGVGIPIVIIIIIIVFLLCNRRRNTEDRCHKENEQNEITNMNNKCIDTNIINTIPPSNMCLKITNEDCNKTYKNITKNKKHLNVVEKCNNKQINRDLSNYSTTPSGSSTTRDYLDNRDLKKPPLRHHMESCKTIDIDSTSSIDSSVDISEHQSDVRIAKPVDREANSNCILYLEKHRHPYSEGMLATEV